ncbi:MULTISPECIES: hypothetical protein [Allobacillus]|uniref:DNA primase n=1 Tax=Allobacillus salarius TaxID=1955272 RepID=A0A556PMR9_9BACI|nr:hypothetical protein [Allobacillus salarius]TSJ65677.1 hypothetical protein FPQ13_06390 [Allobacillus salarius]
MKSSLMKSLLALFLVIGALAGCADAEDEEPTNQEQDNMEEQENGDQGMNGDNGDQEMDDGQDNGDQGMNGDQDSEDPMQDELDQEEDKEKEN